ncbi:MAG: hypothetical protein ACXADW_02885 [Candidatus Hodarchaeales archaeon]|jgi:hypothetical protein
MSVTLIGTLCVFKTMYGYDSGVVIKEEALPDIDDVLLTLNSSDKSSDKSYTIKLSDVRTIQTWKMEKFKIKAWCDALLRQQEDMQRTESDDFFYEKHES